MKAVTGLCSQLLLGGILLTGALAPSSVPAATSTASIAVTATVLSFCTVAALPLTFGNYSSSQVDANTTITAACTLNTPYNIGLDVGTGAGATTGTRVMTAALGGGTLNYGLYQDAARTTVWGNTIGTNTLLGSGSGLPQAITVFGRIPAGQLPAPGAYTDTVLVTLTY